MILGLPAASGRAPGGSLRPLGASWGRLGPVLGPSWAVLGPSGAILGRLGLSWDRLGAFWGRLGAVLGRLGAILWRLGAVLAAQPFKKHRKATTTSKTHEFFIIFHHFKSCLGALLGRLGAVFKSFFPSTSKLRRPEGPKRKKTGQPGAHLVRWPILGLLLLGYFGGSGSPSGTLKVKRF